MAEVLLDNRYRLVEQLGAGGMAVVWRGYDEVLGRQIAIKVLGPELAADPAFVKRLRAEAQAAARLSHPRITSVHDYGESPSPDGAVRPYVVMELVEGETLHSLLSGGRQLPWRRATSICAEVAMALAEAHERGIVHRDVSSSNVMLTPTGVKVLDFGISALIGEHESADLTSLLGTPAYVAPERLSEGEITPAVDVYAVGILLYRCLRGSLPWVVEGPTELLHAHRWLAPAPLPPLPGLPSKVAALCYRCLAKDPAGRPSSAELAAALAKISGMRIASPLVTSTTLDGGVSRTAVLPWHTRLITPIASAATVTQAESAPKRKLRRKPLVAGLALAALALAGFSLPWQDQPNRWTAGQVTGGSGGAAPAQPSCHVIYLLKTDDGKQFEAAITVHNRGTVPVDAWQLEFAWPGRQSVVAAQEAVWVQSGHAMVVRPHEATEIIAPGASRNLALSGTYSGVNALPADFRLTGKSCQTTVAGATATVVTVADEQDNGNGKRKKGKGDGDDDDDD